MYELNYTQNDLLDLKEDFYMNKEDDLYEFINGDVDAAFFLGMNFDEWFKGLPTKDQQYLYSSQARRNSEELEDYNKQFEFWYDKGLKMYSDNQQVDLVELSEYVINSMIFQPGDEDLVINLAFFLGTMVGRTISKNEDVNIEFTKDENKSGKEPEDMVRRSF